MAEFSIPNIPTFVLENMARFDREAEARAQDFITLIEARPPPPNLYHYTNDTGLRGILESGALWFTDIFDLNDPSELRHGYSHASRLLSERWRSSIENLPEKQRLGAHSILQYFSREMDALGNEGGLAASAHYFVCSFSSNGDELGQWRSYADNGRGFALEFDRSELEHGFGDGNGHHSTFWVNYDEEPLLDLHRKLVDDAISLVVMTEDSRWPRIQAELRSPDELDALRNFLIEVSTLTGLHAIRTALLFKHKAYVSESEYRFLQMFAAGSEQLPEDIKYRSRPYSLVRYREYPWRIASPRALRRIIVGPAADSGAMEFAQDCLRAYHSGAVELVRSPIPYRVR